MPIATISRERIEQINGQFLNAGAIGFLKGTIVAFVSGSFLSYRYNHGHNKRFFLPQCKAGYFIAWGIVGISFAVENAKISVAKDLAEEEDLKRQIGNVDPLIRFLKAYDIGEDAIWFEVFQLTVKQPISEKELLYVDDRLEYFRKEPYCLEDNVEGFLSALAMKDISLKVSSKQSTSYSHSNASTGKKTYSDANGSSVAMSAGANSDASARKQRSKNCGRHYNPPHGPGAQESAKMEKSTETGDRFSGIVVNISVYSTSGLLEPPDAVLESPYTNF